MGVTMSDHEIKDGKIIPNPPGQFEFGERYVECYYCGTKRPVDRLKLTHREKPVCVDEDMKFCTRQDDSRRIIESHTPVPTKR